MAPAPPARVGTPLFVPDAASPVCRPVPSPVLGQQRRTAPGLVVRRDLGAGDSPHDSPRMEFERDRPELIGLGRHPVGGGGGQPAEHLAPGGRTMR